MSVKNYVFGSCAPRIRAKDSNGVVIQTWDLPLTGAGGLTESWTSNDVEGESIDLDTLQTSYEFYEGFYRGTWTLDYSELLKGSNVVFVADMINAQKNGYTLWLYPRYSENPVRGFKTKLLGDFDIGILHGGTNAPGNKGLTLIFKGLDTFEYLEWGVPPDEVNFMEINAPIITFQIST